MHVLLCVSDFPYSTVTIEFAKKLLPPVQAHITILTVRPTEEALHFGEQVINQAEKLLAGFYIQSIIKHGKPDRAILEEARRGGYDLIVVGARDKASLGERILGSVARKVVLNLAISTLTVRHPPREIHKIMICTSGQRVSDTTVKAGALLARAMNATVYLLHVTASAPMMFSGLMRLEEGIENLMHIETPLARRLRRSCLVLDEMGVEANLELRHGVPSEEILLASKQNEIDLIMLGRHPYRFGRLLMDDVGLEVLDHTTKPVLVAHYDLCEKFSNT